MSINGGDIMSDKKMTMLDYVYETPQAVRNNVKNSFNITKNLVDLFLKKDYKRLWIIASGSSYNASQCAKLFIEKYLNIEVKIISPFTFNYYESNLKDDDFAIVISQSGCSTNSIDSLKKLNELKIESIGVTANLDSDFKDYATHIIDYGCGIETVGYVTKGVVTLSVFLMLFSVEASYAKGNLTSEEKAMLLNQISDSMSTYEEITRNTLKLFKDNYKSFTSMTNAYVCGCGISFGAALEGALKIGETIQIPAVAYEAEEFLHGPNLQLNPLYTLFFIDNEDSTSQRTIEIYHAVRSITDRAFIITNNKTVDEQHALRFTSQPNPYLKSIYTVAFFQVLSFMVTNELHKWEKHPLYNKFKTLISYKSKSYIDREC
ncbi:SIS domain-containing protein [Acidilutibacter cellobiosedens]|jgi:glucoselysine-6-phosphate deglycase|uniref:SIS domain-containing protein n=2 Tax=Acidilutibacter cellobiosedens TaxID=2507161 RepID=A0A410QFP1_9FIRM|nr:SIS domain-containing protein [Acidilutibacter cellobiosedens]